MTRTQWRTLVTRTLRRDEGRCQTCGDTATDADHIIPIACGGSSRDADNLQALCRACHAAKSKSERVDGRRRSRAEATAGDSPVTLSDG